MTLLIYTDPSPQNLYTRSQPTTNDRNAHHPHLRIRAQNVRISHIPGPTFRLHTKHIIAPPRSPTPPHRSHPHITRLRQHIQHPLHSLLTNRIRTASKLHNNSLLTICFEPSCSISDTF